MYCSLFPFYFLSPNILIIAIVIIVIPLGAFSSPQRQRLVQVAYYRVSHLSVTHFYTLGKSGLGVSMYIQTP